MASKTLIFQVSCPENINRLGHNVKCVEIKSKDGRKVHSITLDNFRINSGHDDSLAYQADILDNKKFIAHVWNDGWGGPSCIQPNPENMSAYTKCENFIKNNDLTWTITKKGEKPFFIDLALDFIVDIIAESMSYGK